MPPADIPISSIPDISQSNGWFDQLGSKGSTNTLTRRERADWAIIGGGICGLTAARRLAELKPDDRIVVVDAARIGYATSGRNAGFMLSHHTHGGIKHLDTAHRIDHLCSGGYQHLRKTINECQIQCDWNEWGQIYVSVGKDGEASIEEVAKGFDILNVDYTWLDTDDLERLTATRYHQRGVHVRDSALVHPAALMRGLGKTLPRNVEVFEDSPVQRVSRGTPITLHCPQGSVAAKNVILATHLFTEAFGYAKNTVVPIATFASLTRRLRPAERNAIGISGQFGLLPASPSGSTVRFTADNRIFMRNTLHYSPTDTFSSPLLQQVTDNHRQAIARRWPTLHGVELDSTWGGVLAFTRNEGTVFGEFAPNIYAAITTDAAPMTRGVMMGKLLAEKICGHDSEELKLLQSLPKASRLPPKFILRHFAGRRVDRLNALGANER